MSLKARLKAQYQTRRDCDYLKEKPPIPRNMLLELSNACNHACAFCPNPHMQRPKRLMNDQLVKRIISEAAEAGVKEIGFYSTGEPFVHKSLADFIAHAKAVGIEYTYISTNGAMAVPERAIKVIEAGLDSIKFSINAGSSETYKLIHGHDDFAKVIENISFISKLRQDGKHKYRLFVSCVVTKPVEAEIEGIKSLFQPLVDEIEFSKCTPFNWPDEALSANAEICHMPFNRIHVTAEGYLTLCCVDYQNYLAVADLNKMSLKEAWNCEAYVKARKMHLENKLAGNLCGRCWRNDPSPVQPLRADLADVIDYEAYDQSQRTIILEKLRTLNVESD